MAVSEGWPEAARRGSGEVLEGLGGELASLASMPGCA